MKTKFVLKNTEVNVKKWETKTTFVKYSGPQKKNLKTKTTFGEKIQWSAEKGKRRRHKIQW